jgi:hypothetical protein
MVSGEPGMANTRACQNFIKQKTLEFRLALPEKIAADWQTFLPVDGYDLRTCGKKKGLLFQRHF